MGFPDDKVKVNPKTKDKRIITRNSGYTMRGKKYRVMLEEGNNNKTVKTFVGC